MSEGFIARGFRGRREPSDTSGRLPPGQYLERGFPVLSAGPTPHTPLAAWDFSMVGEVDQPKRWSWDEFRALPRETVTKDIHCVTNKLATRRSGGHPGRNGTGQEHHRHGSQLELRVTQTNPSKHRTIRTNRRSMMEIKLDNNAAGGVLQVTFPFDMTLVQATCAGCGATNALGAIVAYMHGMGTVVRCQSCDTVLIRIAQARGHYLLDMPGIRVLEIDAQS
jgi:Family of unknown function (DUF6510)/Oxidoreductase molybdopterin binding domain